MIPSRDRDKDEKGLFRQTEHTSKRNTSVHERATFAPEETPIVFELIRGLLLHRTIMPTREEKEREREKEREMISRPTG